MLFLLSCDNKCILDTTCILTTRDQKTSLQICSGQCLNNREIKVIQRDLNVILHLKHVCSDLECLHRKWPQSTACTESECLVFSCRRTDRRSGRWRVTSQHLSEPYVFHSSSLRSHFQKTTYLKLLSKTVLVK